MRPLHRGLTGVDHIAVPVSDVALGERFYADLLRGERVQRSGSMLVRGRSTPPRSFGRAAVRYPAGPLFELTSDDRPRVAMTVRPEDLLAFRALLVANGVKVDGPRQSGPAGHASLFFLDPFGHRLEIVTMGYSGDVATGEPDFDALAWTSG